MSTGPDETRPATPPPTEALHAEVTQLRETVARLEQEYAESLADSGVIQEDRDTLRILLENTRQQLETAEKAEERSASGTYGLCTVCGKPISPERLEALPDATTCIDCQSRRG